MFRSLATLCRRVARRRGGDRSAALLKFRFRSFAVISRPRALRQACLSRDALPSRARSISLVDRQWPRVAKAQPVSGNRRTPEGVVSLASASGPGSRCASRMLSACYATTTRAPPAGTCTENASNSGKAEYSHIWSPAAERVRGLKGRGIRICGRRRVMIWRLRLAAVGVGAGIWRRILTGRLPELPWGWRKTRSVVDEPGRIERRRRRTAARGPSVCPARGLARRRQHLRNLPPVPLTLQHTLLIPPRGIRSLSSCLIGSGEQMLSYFSG